ILFVRFGRHYRTDQFDKSGDDTEQQAGQIEPCGVQPFIEADSDQPPHKGCGRQHQAELAIASDLKPKLLVGFLITAWHKHQFWATEDRGENCLSNLYRCTPFRGPSAALALAARAELRSRMTAQFESPALRTYRTRFAT